MQDLTPTSFIIKEKKAQPTLAGNDSNTRKTVTPSTESISDSNTDVKRQFSLSPDTDRAYMDAVENANIEAAQVMVDEAAKQTGFTEEVYHGTRRGFGFTKYDPSKSNVESAFFTSGELAVARTYSQDDGVTVRWGAMGALPAAEQAT